MSRIQNIAPPKLVLFYPIYLALVLISFVLTNNEMISTDHLVSADAELYQIISENGYIGEYLTAFFPLFPKLWGLFGLNEVFISIFNGLLFMASAYFLLKELKVSLPNVLFILAVPGIIFYFIPFSESFFFVGATMLIIGLMRKHMLLFLCGIAVCALSRPAYTILLPAFLGTLLLIDKDAKIRNMFLLGALVMVMCTLLVGVWQYQDTGEWFTFFGAQKHWGNELRIPELPLTSWSEELIVRYDGIALLAGACSGGYLLYHLIRKWTKKSYAKIPVEVTLSLFYLTGISLAVLLFRGGELFSLNRFVFSTAFFFIALNYFLKLDWQLNIKKILIIFFFIVGYWMLFGAYVHIQFLLKFLLLSVGIAVFLIFKADFGKTSKIAQALCLLGLFGFQIALIYRYLNGLWIA